MHGYVNIYYYISQMIHYCLITHIVSRCLKIIDKIITTFLFLPLPLSLSLLPLFLLCFVRKEYIEIEHQKVLNNINQIKGLPKTKMIFKTVTSIADHFLTFILNKKDFINR